MAGEGEATHEGEREPGEEVGELCGDNQGDGELLHELDQEITGDGEIAGGGPPGSQQGTRRHAHPTDEPGGVSQAV